MKPCQRRGFQFLFSERQIGFFKSGALHIDHKDTCISCRKGQIGFFKSGALHIDHKDTCISCRKGQIGFFKSGALHIDHKDTCISCRKGNIADVGSMQEYDICICIACQSCLINLFIPVFYEPSPIFLTCLEVLL